MGYYSHFEYVEIGRLYFLNVQHITVLTNKQTDSKSCFSYFLFNENGLSMSVQQYEMSSFTVWESRPLQCLK